MRDLTVSPRHRGGGRRSSCRRATCPSCPLSSGRCSTTKRAFGGSTRWAHAHCRVAGCKPALDAPLRPTGCALATAWWRRSNPRLWRRCTVLCLIYLWTSTSSAGKLCVAPTVHAPPRLPALSTLTLRGALGAGPAQDPRAHAGRAARGPGGHARFFRGRGLVEQPHKAARSNVKLRFFIYKSYLLLDEDS